MEYWVIEDEDRPVAVSGGADLNALRRPLRLFERLALRFRADSASRAAFGFICFSGFMLFRLCFSGMSGLFVLVGRAGIAQIR